VRVLAAPDKFRGTASAHEAAAAIASAGWDLGLDVDECPLSDGGEGILAVLGGANRTSRVTGPHGRPVDAPWRLHGRVAVIEMALASGLELAGGAAENDALGATTAGTGELIAKAIDQGARTVLVGLGGSATTDGGLGAVEAIGGVARIRSVALEVACDVRTRFVDAAAVFAPQKGASAAQVQLLTARLNRLADRYLAEYGVDVRSVDGTGAAGGLAGGLLAIGGRLLPGFDLVADHVDLHERLADADVVVTGEGYLDQQSLDGKVVGGILELAAEATTPVVVICGDGEAEVRDSLAAAGTVVVSLVERYGDRRPFDEPRWCIEHAARETLAALAAR
jgi:glycerate kinase